MAKQKGGTKLRRAAKKVHYYAAQKNVTARNKARRAMKRQQDVKFWASPIGQDKKEAKMEGKTTLRAKRRKNKQRDPQPAMR